MSPETGLRGDRAIGAIKGYHLPAGTQAEGSMTAMNWSWLSALTVAPAVAFAATSNSTAILLNPVTVTATRTPVLQMNELPPTLVITRAQIERSDATSVVGLLREFAGLEISQAGGPGQPASLFIRGANSNYTVLLIDGVRIDDATTGAPPLAEITPEMIQRIEVIEGPRAALYGADAIGGVINIITRKPGPARLDASVSGGSLGTLSVGAALRDQGKIDHHAWGAVFDIQQDHIDGLPPFAGSAAAAAYRNRTLNGRGTLDIDGVHLQFRAWDASGNSQYLNTDFSYPPPAYHAVFSGFSPAAEDFHDQVLACEAADQLTSIWHSNFTLSRSLYYLRQNQPDPGTSRAGFARVIRPELDWHNIIDADRHNRVSFGVRAYQQRVSALSYGSAYSQSKATEYGYLEEEGSYGRNHVVGAASYLHDGVFGGRFDWNLGYGYDLFPATRLIAAAGSAFRAPTATELYYPGISNPDLQPEKAISYSIDVRQRIGRYQSLRFGLFRTDVRDYIAYGVDFIPHNVQRARLEGMQANWRYVSAGWTARIDAIWQDPRNLTTDEPLLRRARLIGSAAIERHAGRYEFGGAIYSSTLRHDIGAIAGAPTTAGGYTLVSLNAGVQLTPRLHLGVRLENLLNHHYQTVAGYNQPGSTVYATLRYRFPL